MEYTIKQGNTLSKIALYYGLRSYVAIYDHPESVDFRTLRPARNLAYPGGAF